MYFLSRKKSWTVLDSYGDIRSVGLVPPDLSVGLSFVLFLSYKIVLPISWDPTLNPTSSLLPSRVSPSRTKPHPILDPGLLPVPSQITPRCRVEVTYPVDCRGLARLTVPHFWGDYGSVTLLAVSSWVLQEHVSVSRPQTLVSTVRYSRSDLLENRKVHLFV